MTRSYRPATRPIDPKTRTFLIAGAIVGGSLVLVVGVFVAILLSQPGWPTSGGAGSDGFDFSDSRGAVDWWARHHDDPPYPLPKVRAQAAPTRMRHPEGPLRDFADAPARLLTVSGRAGDGVHPVLTRSQPRSGGPRHSRARHRLP